MGKNKRQTIQCFDSIHNIQLEMDSIEEVEFLKWLIRAVELKIVTDFEYQPKSFILSNTVKYKDQKGKEKTLFQPHIYSPDFLVTVNKNCITLKNEFKLLNNFQIYIDVKGVFARNGSDRAFSINQKWMMDKHGIYIFKLVPKKFFSKVGIPKELRFTNKTKKISKKYDGYPLIDDVFST